MTLPGMIYVGCYLFLTWTASYHGISAKTIIQNTPMTMVKSSKVLTADPLFSSQIVSVRFEL